MRTRLSLTQLEDKLVPAVVDLVGGVLTFQGDGAADVVTLYKSGGSYVLNDSAANITLGSGAIAEGWKGNGTKTVTGPVTSVSQFGVLLGDGNDVFNLRASDVPVNVSGEGGTDTVNISSNAPSNTGNLLGILGAVDVDAETLVVSDQGATSGNSNVVIDATSITGLAGPTDTIDITYSNVATLRVVGSSGSFAEGYTVDSPAASTLFQLNMNAGSNTVTVLQSAPTETRIFGGTGVDTVALGDGLGTPLSGTLVVSVAGGDDEITVLSNCSATFGGGLGNDLLTISSGVTVTGTAAGFEVENFNTFGFGDLI